MKQLVIKSSIALAVGILIAVGYVYIQASRVQAENAACNTEIQLCTSNIGLEYPSVLSSIELSNITVPDWLKKERAPAPTPVPSGGSRGIDKTVTYSVETRGNTSASLAEFKQQSNETLNDARGWSRLGVRFQEVPSGGNFTLVLSEASQVPSFAPNACSSTYSCRVGRYVIINQDRWLGATPSWNDGGGSLRDYRHMVVNHETGHWLGHGHYTCGGAGQPAPLMQQQSISLQGCTFNAWPTASELRSPTLGR